MSDQSITALARAHDWYSRQEAAELLGVSVRTLDRIIAAGRLGVTRVGGGVRVPAEELDRYLLTHYRQPALPLEMPTPRRSGS